MKKITILLSVLFLVNPFAVAQEVLSAADAAVIKAENEALKKKLAALESAKKEEAKAQVVADKPTPPPAPVVEKKRKSDIKESFDTEVDDSKEHISDARSKFKERAKERGFLSNRETPPATPKTVRQAPTKRPTTSATQATQRPVVVESPKQTEAPAYKVVEPQTEPQEEKKSDSVWDHIFPF